MFFFFWHFKMIAIKLWRLKVRLDSPDGVWPLVRAGHCVRSLQEHLVACTHGEGVVDETLGPAFPVKRKPSVTLQPHSRLSPPSDLQFLQYHHPGNQVFVSRLWEIFSTTPQQWTWKAFQDRILFQAIHGSKKWIICGKNSHTKLMSRAQKYSWITKCSWCVKEEYGPEFLSKLLLWLLFSLWGLLMLNYHSLTFSFLSHQCVTMVPMEHWPCSGFVTDINVMCINIVSDFILQKFFISLGNMETKDFF